MGFEPSLLVAVALSSRAGRPEGTSTISARVQLFEPFILITCWPMSFRNGGGKTSASGVGCVLGSAFAGSVGFGVLGSGLGLAGTMMNAVALSLSTSLVSL